MTKSLYFTLLGATLAACAASPEDDATAVDRGESVLAGCFDKVAVSTDCGNDPGAKDADGDGALNCVDGDIDGDGVANAVDCDPYHSLASLSACDGSDLAEKDYDDDGVRNCEDPDIDGDGIANASDGNPYGSSGKAAKLASGRAPGGSPLAAAALGPSARRTRRPTRAALTSKKVER